MTITLTKPKTQVIWRSPDPGDKSTSIPGSDPTNKGYALHIKSTLADGSTYIVAPTSGTIGGAASFTFTEPEGEGCDLSLISDADNGDWVVRCLCCTPSIPVTFTVGAVIFGGITKLWNFPAMADSPTGTLSVWLYLTSDQETWVPNGDLFNFNRGYLFNDPGTSNGNFIGQGGFQSWPAGVGVDQPINDLIDVSRTNPSVWTFSAPHGITAGSYITRFDVGHSNRFITGPWDVPPGDFWREVFSVTSTTITVDFDFSSATIPWATPTGDNAFGHAGAHFQVVNSPQLFLSNGPGGRTISFMWGGAVPHDQWVNALINWKTDLSSHNKVATLYYGDTQQILTSQRDADPAFDIFYSEPQTDEFQSWHLGGAYSGSGFGIRCYMAECWFAPGQFLDFTVSANRRKFHDASNRPVSVGVDGSGPTGVAPTLYLTISRDETVADNFATNLSGAGPLSVAGDDLTIAPTSPSD